MKVTKSFSLDLDVVQALQNMQNSSILVNSYLRSYLDLGKPERKKTVLEVQTENDLKEVLTNEVG